MSKITLATLTSTGRAVMAQALSLLPIHVALGTGDTGWADGSVERPLLINSTSLVAEIGRKIPSAIGFVVPDEAGDISIPVEITQGGRVIEQRYRQVEHPTAYFYIRVNFEYEEAPDAIISEIGIFMNAIVKDGLPPGQRYFLPDEIKAQGDLFAIEILPRPLIRNINIKNMTELVLAI